MPVTEIISLVANFILGSGIIGLFIFYRAKRRTANAEATSAENSSESVAIANMRESAVEWKEIAEARDVKLKNQDLKLDAKDALIDRLYSEKSEDRSAIHTLTLDNAKLRLELQAAVFRACTRRGCADREPQTGY